MRETKNTYFKKRTGEVVENKEKGYMNSQKRTGKRSGEVVENTRGLKKRTGNKPKNKPGHFIENTGHPKIGPHRTRARIILSIAVHARRPSAWMAPFC
ncbi:MAG: hypothetical protein EPN47_19215 [Acidobacteria bacterium]|nr:MAG: hypothetical protein EPN47_19215 [Acidobacteriota bacterium]